MFLTNLSRDGHLIGCLKISKVIQDFTLSDVTEILGTDSI